MMPGLMKRAVISREYLYEGILRVPGDLLIQMSIIMEIDEGAARRGSAKYRVSFINHLRLGVLFLSRPSCVLSPTGTM